MIVGCLTSACQNDPCVSVCERQRDDGCVVIAVVQLPCSQQCEQQRDVPTNCDAEIDAYYACADAQAQVCGEDLAAACGPENEALIACRTS